MDLASEPKLFNLVVCYVVNIPVLSPYPGEYILYLKYMFAGAFHF